MMFWGDILLKYPKLVGELPRGVIALNWGYEANHPFAKEAAQFAKAGIPFYICPGTSTWQTFIGRHDNALANLREAAKAGKQWGALGYLNTDWGDGGHPQPLAVSWPLFAAGAALAWNSRSLEEKKIRAALSRDVFEDPTGQIADAGWRLGLAHRRLGIRAPNETPLGTVLAAPRPEDRELFCRNGLKWAAQIPPKKILTTLKEIRQQRAALKRANPYSCSGKLLAGELDLAARMAEQSCQFMLWQQAARKGKNTAAKQMAKRGIRELRELEKDFSAGWPLRNKGTPKHCSPFLKWRIQDYQGS
jgi:hexosaminidase